MSEATFLRPVSESVQLLARVLDCDVDELIDRALDDAVEKALADADVRQAFDALKRLEARRAEDRPDLVPGEGGWPIRLPITGSGVDEPLGRIDVPGSAGSSSRETEEKWGGQAGDLKRAADVLTTEQRRLYASTVRGARMAQDLSQVQLAEILGVAPSTVSMIERGAHAVAADTLRQAVQWAEGQGGT